MDKNTIPHAQITHPDSDRVATYPLPVGKRGVHDDFGVWISRTYPKATYKPVREIRPRKFAYYSLAHLIEGDGWYWEKGVANISKINAGQAILMQPGVIHSYGGYEKIYVEDAIGFNGPVIDRLRRCGVISDRIVHVGKNRRLLPIIEMALDPSRDSQIRASVELINLLTAIHFENKKKREPASASRVRELLTKIHHDLERNWTVAEMAEFCNYSVNQFRRLFHKEIGLNPKEYVDSLKIKKAAEILTRENVLLSEVAERFGYSDPYHFSRRFKEIIGLSPKHYLNTFAG